MLAKWWERARGSVFCGLWLASILSGWLLLCCPLLPLMLFRPRLYRVAIDIVFAMWELYPAVSGSPEWHGVARRGTRGSLSSAVPAAPAPGLTRLTRLTLSALSQALIRLVLRIAVKVTGDEVSGGERALLVMNHRTRLDWNFLWAGLQRASSHQATRLKFVLKAPIAHVPGPGWVMQMACHLYIHRSWERDQQLLAQSLRFFRDTCHTCQVRPLRGNLPFIVHDPRNQVSCAIGWRVQETDCESRTHKADSQND